MTMVMTMDTRMSQTVKTRTIKASEFKAKCLALMDEVARTGESVVITKNGLPVAELGPHKKKKKSPFGILKDELVIVGDIMSPIDVEWNAMK
jgi:prevent-host-death family protein